MGRMLVFIIEMGVVWSDRLWLSYGKGNYLYSTTVLRIVSEQVLGVSQLRLGLYCNVVIGFWIFFFWGV